MIKKKVIYLLNSLFWADIEAIDYLIELSSLKVTCKATK